MTWQASPKEWAMLVAIVAIVMVLFGLLPPQP
jgi:hypothetical protein